MTTATADIYIPPNTYTLEKLEVPQVRLGIQGFPGTGKTWSALTFPNPIVLDLDKGLGAHRGRADVVQVPLLDQTYAIKICPSAPGNLKELILEWLRKEGKNLTPKQTLILDGLTGTEFAYHKFYVPKISTRTGKVDEFDEWQTKVTYFTELTEECKKLKCNFILLSHESERRDKPTTIGQPGEYTGKIRPLITGQYVDKISGQFTDWFRQFSMAKPDVSKLTDVQKKNIEENWLMTVGEFESMLKKEGSRSTLYYWQLAGDDLFDGKCSSLVNYPKFIPANYETFCKYLRKS